MSILLRGTRVEVRSARVADVDRILELWDDPLVRAWWPRLSADELRRDIANAGGGAFCIEHERVVVGYIQCYEELEADYRHAGIDLFLGAEYHGIGLGSDAVLALARHLVEDRGHHRLVIDPAAANVRAIRCYERIGFRRVGIMRSYERGIDGAWHDGLLMDLLASEMPPR